MNIFSLFLIAGIFTALHTLLFASPSSDKEAKIKTHFFRHDIEKLNISSWENPTFEDYLLIQDHIKANKLAALDTPLSLRPFDNDSLNYGLHGCITYRMCRTQIIKDASTMPSFNTIYFNNDPEKKEKCIICYATYPMAGAEDRDYTRGIQFLIESLKAFNFDGHFIYRIGGWPHLQKGRLKFADVPYSFKPFLFEEVRDLGYKKILWLDAAAIPVKSVDPFFDVMEREGCCFFTNGILSEKDFITNGYEHMMASLNIPTKQYTQLLSQVVGLNLNHPKASTLLDLWIRAAEEKTPFLATDGDQSSFTFLVDKLGLLSGKLPDYYYTEGTHRDFTHPKRNPQSILYHQYEFLNPLVEVPDDIFRR